MTDASRIQVLRDAGQSIWLDYIHRDLLDTDKLNNYISQDGLRGITSNPSIFEKAITDGATYDAAIARAVEEHGADDLNEIFNAVAIQDIRDACDAFKDVYESSKHTDGFVSIEVSPTLAHDTAGTIAEAKRLHAWVDRPNVMIKIPGTEAGLAAIEEAIACGIHVNVTLLFAVQRYQQVVEAHIRGLERRAAAGDPVSDIASVASFFVSRVDAVIDNIVIEKNAQHLQGKAAIANAKKAYQYYESIYNGERFASLKNQGAQVQRLLWASTSTKNPNYPDTLYVDDLIGPATVNTLPPATYDAFKDHGTIAQTLTLNVDESLNILTELDSLGIDLKDITNELEAQGIKAFQASFENLLRAIGDKIAQLNLKQQAG